MFKKYLGIYDRDEETRCKIALMKYSGLDQETISYHITPTVDTEYIHTLIIDDKRISDKVR
jgi:hypothetical protein